MKVRCNECLEVMVKEEVVTENVCPRCKKTDCLEDFETQYNVGDKVVYLDIHGDEMVGTISGITCTQILDWNKESKPLYFVGRDAYVRTEEEILRLYVKDIVLTEEEKELLKKNLYNTLIMFAEYHADLEPNEDDSLEVLVESYCYWADEYNGGYMTEMDNTDDKISAYLVQEYHKLDCYC